MPNPGISRNKKRCYLIILWKLLFFLFWSTALENTTNTFCHILSLNRVLHTHILKFIMNYKYKDKMRQIGVKLHVLTYSFYVISRALRGKSFVENGAQQQLTLGITVLSLELLLDSMSCFRLMYRVNKDQEPDCFCSC